jgi:PBSX family phage terminase large subunit
MLSEAQRVAIRDSRNGPENICLWEGAVRSGKTMSSILAWCDYVRHLAPPGPLVMIGKTKDTLGRNVLDEIDTYFGDASPLQHTRGANEGRLFGRKVHMVGANDAKAESKIRGLTLAGAYVDEATLLPGEGYWSMLLTRHITTFPGGAKIFATTNPDSPAHWLKRNVIDRAPQVNARVFHFALDDNPILTAEAKAQLKTSLSGLFYKRFIEGLWVAAEGAIFDMLDLDIKHRTTWEQLPILTGDMWLGIDYGDMNPFHAVLIGLGIDQRLYVLAEWRYDGRTQRRQMEQTEYEAALRKWLEQGAGILIRPARGGGDLVPAVGLWPDRIAVDPSAAGFHNVLRNRGWTGLTTPEDKINPVRDGIRNIGSLLGLGRLQFVEGAAPELEREMLGYVWDEKAAARGEDTPVKVDDHGVDALRYAVASARQVWRPWLGNVA